MKRIIYALLAVSVGFTACQKEQNINSLPHNESIADADLTGTKATMGESKKNSPNTLDIDYELIIKKTGIGMGKVGMRVTQLRHTSSQGGNNDDNDNLLRDAISNVVISLNNTKSGAEIPLNIELKSNGLNGNTFTFPEFAYKGDLDYELINVKASFKLKDGSITVKDKSTFNFVGSTITVTGGDMVFGDNSSFKLPTGSTVTVNGAKLETNFAILFEGTGKGGVCEDESDFILLPNGHSVEQDPTVKKVTFPYTEDGRVMRITIVGDPGEKVESVYYTPLPIPDPNNPGATIQPPVIHFNTIGRNKKKRITMEDSNGDIDIFVTKAVKPSDFNVGGPGWARITLVYAQ